MLRKLRRFAALPAAQRSDFLSSLALLPSVALGLRLFGFRRCHRWLVRPTSEAPATDVAPAADTARMVVAAGALLPLRPTCLTRSMALTFLLRRRGLPAELRVGVRKADNQFAAHAWVECLGEAFGRSDGNFEYAAFERITPSP